MTIASGGRTNVQPWGVKTQPDDECQFFNVITDANSGRANAVTQFNRAYYTTFAAYRFSVTADTQTSSPSGDFVSIIGKFTSQNAQIGAFAVNVDQDDININLIHAGGVDQEATSTLLAAMYASASFVQEAQTLGGLKDGTLIADPTTDYAGAPAHTSQPTAVQQVTFTGGITKTFIYFANTISLGGTFGLAGNIQMWNFNTSAWINIASAFPGYFDNGSGGFARSVYGQGFFHSANFVSSNISYIKYICSGSSPSVGASSPIFYQGEANPTEDPS